MSEIPENLENPKTPEGGTPENSDTPSGELTRKEMKVKMNRMSRRIASLKRKSSRLKKASKVTPAKLDFDRESGRKQGGNPEKEANPERENEEHSQTASVSVFDRLGRKLTEQDLQHRLCNKAPNGDEPEGSQHRAPPSQR